jgi:hypothetical protein
MVLNWERESVQTAGSPSDSDRMKLSAARYRVFGEGEKKDQNVAKAPVDRV